MEEDLSPQLFPSYVRTWRICTPSCCTKRRRPDAIAKSGNRLPPPPLRARSRQELPIHRTGTNPSSNGQTQLQLFRCQGGQSQLTDNTSLSAKSGFPHEKRPLARAVRGGPTPTPQTRTHARYPRSHARRHVRARAHTHRESIRRTPAHASQLGHRLSFTVSTARHWREQRVRVLHMRQRDASVFGFQVRLCHRMLQSTRRHAPPCITTLLRVEQSNVSF